MGCHTRRWPKRFREAGRPSSHRRRGRAPLLRSLISALLAVAGTLLGLYGIFALAFREGSGPMHVDVAGREIDARLAGGLSLAAALLIVASAVAVSRRPHSGR